MEDVKNVPVGKVLKVDGAYVAVKFPGTSSNTNCQSNSGSDADPSSLLQDCRLLRIDELQVVKTGGTPKFLTASRELLRSFVYLRRRKY